MLIVNASLITLGENPQLLPHHALYIQDGLVGAIGARDELTAKYPDAEVMDAQGQYVMPGNICAHTHFYGAYARGMAIPGPPPPDFPQILQRLWWPLDKALSKDSVRASALVCLLDAIKHGATSLVDHHASPQLYRRQS